MQKETAPDRLLSTLRDVINGELRVPADVVRRVFARVRSSSKLEERSDHPRLTQRERDILASFATGMSYAEIAEARGVQPVTVRNAIYGIQNKLAIDTMQGTVVWAVRNGLLDGYVHGRLAFLLPYA